MSTVTPSKSTRESIELKRALASVVSEVSACNVDTIARIKLPDFIGEVRKVLRVIEHLLTCAQARLLHDQIAKCMKDPVCASQWSDAERQEMEDLLLETEVVLQDSCPSIFHP
jgi:hypothetical protein